MYVWLLLLLLEGAGSTFEGTVSGTFAITGNDGNGGHYEPYGSFKIDFHTVWDVSEGSGPSVPNGETYTVPIDYSDSFVEGHTFYLYGKVLEDDGSSSDDLIGNYDNTPVPMADIDGKEWSQTFPGDSDSQYVRITMTLIRK